MIGSTRAFAGFNRVVLASAKQDKLESGARVRIDSTVTTALMHEPGDSAPDFCKGLGRSVWLKESGA